MDNNESTMGIVDAEIEKEMANQSAKKELKVLPVQKTDAKGKQSSSSIVNAFKQKMSLNTTSVELPSIGKTLEFKDIDSDVQTYLSQVALECNSRTDIMYSTMASTMNNLSLDKTFNIRNHTEFERISILLNLQQGSKFNPEIRYVCPKCGKENVYHLDSRALMKKFAKSYRGDCEYEIELGSRKYKFVLGWPSVAYIEDFYKHHYRGYDEKSENGQKAINELAQVQYLVKFVKSITVSEMSDPDDSVTANLEDIVYEDKMAVIGSLPQYLISDENDGIISKVIDIFVKPMNDSFKYENCAFCGAEQEGAMANLTDFMGS